MKHEITHEGTLVQPIALPDQAEHLLRYFRKMRADYADRYREARYWPDRRAARVSVLHFGRLIRRLERRGVAA